MRSDGTLRLEKDNDDVMKIPAGNMGWHHDSTYMPVQAKGAVFCAEEVPTIGGRTGFADMRAAYDALDPAMKARIEGLNAHHSLHYSQGKVGPSTRKADGEYRLQPAMTGRCRCSRWSRPIPRPAASRYWPAATPTTSRASARRTQTGCCAN